ncbi:aspartyl/glutamyl-tRNA amidotransferase subunit C [Mycoplasmopsis synoviae]|uniref:Asp-tRNA(Asn)/Glu-tRNA(Gln) amidotransferase subunit GatC n=1 Tax=Mycoplasmopsis synoviae TaxID=2109 RepID=UPI000CA1F12F|nr:Asp-tRNA(Asn)/Glu-tRNA(Gln) amidotransferase subunit GatC [Mycoplasmopsis synoviae]AKJ21022.1 Aspartyl-tRNA(Asn) amidotransferase subunit C; Glutamyl-tRNA(Gln) amidotransferase subunit C [Mycoplasmopsis synoviae]AQU48357.1 Aspartyl-tRNA(Asn) amidotransferase subunit C; Glutamyl-tRNA(Gln) amidotransferase subunit C [Mycoplasmopsis synoviae]AWL83930.1 aspartyl-tRNA amidotransferase [Mycoplasmopsis synoviae]QLE13661.1 aspartyl-tRNA amidotransferase [Mycoplasmopsis synoviae]UZF64416.1 aspartyl/
MKKFSKKKFLEIAKVIMLESNDELIEKIKIQWDDLLQDLKSLDKLDLKNVEPLTHNNETYYEDFLREDEVVNFDDITKDDILKNAKEKDENYITLVKVVK